MNKGYVIVAQNTDSTDYVQCARVLCRNIKTLMPGSSVALITDQQVQEPDFDHIITFPHGDQAQGHEWKLCNDWQVYDASPYKYTLKIEADIYLPRSIEHWWPTLTQHDLVISTTIRNYTNGVSTERFYRKFIDENHLPDTYNALTYFRKSPRASRFFSIVRDIFDNWEQYRKLVRHDDDIPTTDYVYAIAARIIGEEKCTLPGFTAMSMIHMKQMVNQSQITDWTREYIYEIQPDVFRINTVPQLYPVHYHIKSFAQELEQELYGRE